MGLFKNLFKTVDKKQFPPLPQWRPNTPNDIDKITNTTKYYTGSKLQLAVFKFGTVVFLTIRVDNIEVEAKNILNQVYNFHADFNPRIMSEGNYLIEYRKPAFNIVFKEEIADNWDYIDKNHLQGVCTDEVLINGKGQHNVFDTVGKICLFGRAKMFMDAQDPVVVKTFDPLI